jgi:hypothetical protein
LIWSKEISGIGSKVNYSLWESWPIRVDQSNAYFRVNHHLTTNFILWACRNMQDA